MSTLRHGHARRGRKSRAYVCWNNMRSRCGDPSNHRFSDYGGRGITVCERWQVFENFLTDMGEPEAGKTIDRVDVNGNYEPGNCRWADDREQRFNKRSNRLLTFLGRTQPLNAWAEELGVPRTRIWARLNLGWSAERALTEPCWRER